MKTIAKLFLALACAPAVFATAFDIGISQKNSSDTAWTTQIFQPAGGTTFTTAAGFRTAIGAGSGNGTVTSVGITVPSFLSVSGSPVTTSGTLAVILSGTALPASSGGTGLTALGTGVATWLGTPTSANLATAVTDETGTGPLVFAGSPALTGTVTAAGNAAIGTTSVQQLRLGEVLQLTTSANYGGLVMETWSATAAQESIHEFFRSKSNTVGTLAAVALNDALGAINWRAATTGSNVNDAASIAAYVDGTVSNGNLPSRLVFATTPATGAAVTALTLDSAQTAKFAGTAASTNTTSGAVQIAGGMGVAGGINLGGALTTGTPASGTAAAWKLGSFISGVPSGTSGYAQIDVAGAAYQLPTGLVAQPQDGRATVQTAAVTTVKQVTVGAADASYEVSANVNVTTATAHSFSVTCTYTDETSTSRTLTMPFVQIGGVTLVGTITNITGSGPYEGVSLHIRAKASTTITIATSGTFTTVTYNVEGTITQI